MTINVMTIVGPRPEIVKLCRVIHELDRHTDHSLVNSGQNYDYGLNEVFFQQLNIRKPDYFLDAVDKTVAQTIGNVIAKSDEIMVKKTQTHYFFSVIQTVASPLYLLKVVRFRYFIWRRVIAVLIKEYLKNSIARLWITSVISI